MKKLKSEFPFGFFAQRVISGQLFFGVAAWIQGLRRKGAVHAERDVYGQLCAGNWWGIGGVTVIPQRSHVGRHRCTECSVNRKR